MKGFASEDFFICWKVPPGVVGEEIGHSWSRVGVETRHLVGTDLANLLLCLGVPRGWAGRILEILFPRCQAKHANLFPHAPPAPDF